MITNARYTMVDGIKCYDMEMALNSQSYPSAAFDVVDKQEKNIFWCRSRSRLLKTMISKYLKPQGSFLEIGCGTGFFIRELSKNTSYKITGSDIHLSGLKYAKEKSPNTDFIQLDATSNYISEQFDVIGAFDVIEHIENDEAVLSNAYQSLVPGGYLIISVPQYQFLWSKIDELVKHQRRYSKKELTDKLHKQGLEVVFRSSFVFTLFPLMLVSRLLDKKKTKNREFSAADFEKRLKFPSALNWMMDKLMYIDEFLIRLGVSLPFGGSLVVVARKSI